MRLLVPIGLFFVLLPLAWSRLAPPVVYLDSWPDGSAKVRAVSTRTADGEYVFDGPYEAFHQNGRKEREGAMRAGKEEGPWTWWNEDGSVRARGEFHRGTGSITIFHPGGEVRWRGTYRDGLREGVWIEFSEQGRKLREGPYRMDREHGAWTYWHEEDPADSLVVQWEDGRMLEEGEAASASAAVVRTSAWRFVVGVLQWWWILLCPLPVGWAAARSLAGDLPWIHRALVVAVLWCALHVGLVLVLGSAHALTLPAALAAESVGCIVGVMMLRRQRFGVLARGSLSGPDRVMAFSGLVTAAAAFWWLVAMPTDNFDSLAYHLPTVVRWLQQGDLVRPAELGQVAFYPFHWETLAALQLLPLREDVAVALPNLLAWAILGVSVMALARDLGADRTAAWFAAVCVCTLPVALSRLPAIQPDLAVAAFFLASTVLGRIALRRGTWVACLVWASSLGVLLGLKGSALAYAGVSIAFVAAERWWIDAGPIPSRPARWIAVAVIAGAIGGVWYARNAMQTGNPLGFVQVELFGQTLWPGTVDAATLRRGTLLRLFDPGRFDHWRLLGGMVRTELAVPFVALTAGALATLLPRSWRSLGRSRLLLWTGWLVASVLLYWVTPYGADNGAEGWTLTPRVQAGLRFGFPALGALAVIAALGLSRLHRLAPALAAVAVVCAALGLVHSVESGWQVLLIVVGLALGAFWIGRAPSRRAWAVPAMLVVVTVALWMARGERDRWRSTLYGEAYEFVERVVPRDETIGYAMTQTRFPYYGRELDRRLVSVVPTTDSYQEWQETLRSEGVRWLLLGTTSAGEEATSFEPRARDWVDAHADRFETAFAYQSRKRDITVFRVLDEP